MYQMKLTQSTQRRSICWVALCCTAQAAPRQLSQQKVNATPLETGSVAEPPSFVPTTQRG